MGRYDLRPARVRQAAAMLLSSKRITQAPPWFQVMHDVPPPEILVRTLPVQHVDSSKSKKVKKPSRMFQPQRIAYQEDELRADFFGDHPWELARPRVVLESDGKDHHKWDWSKERQHGRPSNGESVVQRQKWLMTNGVDEIQPDTHGQGRNVVIKRMLSKDEAYDRARKELYSQRHFDAVELRVAREEAQVVGATFGKSRADIGMELENAIFDKWKEWAKKQVVEMEQARNAAYSGVGGQPSADELSEPTDEHEDENPLNTAADLLQRDIPNSQQGQGAAGGAAFRP